MPNPLPASALQAARPLLPDPLGSALPGVEPRGAAMGTPLVLVADNDHAVSGLLRDVLLRTGLTVRQAFDGEVAREQARAPDVKVLVCDLDMPRLSGIEVLESLANLASPPQAVVISGYLDSAVRQRLGALGFVREVLRKPFDLLGFAEKVRAIAVGGAPDPAQLVPRPPLEAAEG